jgi:hypothetical protein
LTFKTYRIYNNYVKIEFDPAKREIVLRERCLDLADAGTLPGGNRLDELDDRFDYGEDRWRSLGLLRGEVVACVWVALADRVRIITMWKARRHEQEKFFRFWESV